MTGTGMALPGDYDADPGRFAAGQEATRRFSERGDVHPLIARRFADEGCRTVLDIGGGNGTLARLLTDMRVVVVDRAEHVSAAPRPAVRADAGCLPFRDEAFDGAAALWMLYHVPDPVLVLREARRVLRPRGWLAVSTVSRYNDPELAAFLPLWGRPLSLDAENGPDQLGQVFGDIEIQRWDEPMVHLPDRAALALYLRGRGLSERRAAESARHVDVPLSITKRGMIAWLRA
jgi:SAM-dependent methyltransferase